MPTHPHLDLPAPAQFRRRCRQRTVLDIIFDADSFTFQDNWRPGVALATWEDRQGNEWSAVFAPEGTYLRGFYHDSPMNSLHWQRERVWDGLLDDLPDVLSEYVRNPDVDSQFRYASDPATAVPAITLCAWRLPTDSTWMCSPYEAPPRENEDIEGIEYLFRSVVEWSGSEIAAELSDYLGVDVQEDAMAAILDDIPLDEELIEWLNPEADVAEVTSKAAATGYPVDDD